MDTLEIGWLVLDDPPSLRVRGFRRALYRVSDKDGLLKLIDIFDTYQLRAKKRRDYLLWREAVLNWTKIRRGCRDADWTRMGELFTELREGRRYEAVAA